MALAHRRAQVKLSPPQFSYFREVSFSVGNDPLVRIDPLREITPGVFLITLHVQGLSKAKALATLLTRTKTFGMIRVLVRVRNAGRLVKPITRKLSPNQIEALYRTAYKTNRYFSFVTVQTGFGVTHVYPVYKLRIIQFFNDELSDLYANYNNVAAFVFRNVSRAIVSGTGIRFSTVQKK
ncbi:conserved hypothetical protein [Paenibacillus curdlanolyticus YK9]|uniref:Uncharacterized protein n=1 Tax=Paenibacillus curdlanolyticus YK9 TaxID=717606 RepID=E0IFW3_9BACL|nr:hypothetical protein [Paenibacillus curdlanolyticus]EFM08543.1 conserved hypothetical protein [Paenibacillus curdlanolyticus YK9]